MEVEEKLRSLASVTSPLGTCHQLGKDFTISRRSLPPAHYLFKVEAFSKMSRVFPKNEEAVYKSGTFESGGYKWRMCLYPKGRKKTNGDGHISLYLEIADGSNLPLGWEVNAVVRLFVLDWIRDEYVAVQDANNRVRRFNAAKTEWGFTHFLTLEAFSESSNGYLMDDSCVFGAEVFIVKYSGQGECLSLMNKPMKSTHTWNFENFSTLNEISFYKEFTVGERKWYLKLEPKNKCQDDGRFYVGLSLGINDWNTNCVDGRLYVEYTLRIMDQLNGKHEKITDRDWFSTECKGYVFQKFLLLDDLKLASKGFLVNDNVVVEADVEIISVVKNFMDGKALSC